MTTRTLTVAERRIALRFQTSFVAEFASGTVVVLVTVQDLSTAGCGVVVMDGDPTLPDRVGGRGLLHVPAVDGGTHGTILPVVLRNTRTVERQLVYGLEFSPLLAHQTRKLMGVLEALC